MLVGAPQPEFANVVFFYAAKLVLTVGAYSVDLAVALTTVGIDERALHEDAILPRNLELGFTYGAVQPSLLATGRICSIITWDSPRKKNQVRTGLPAGGKRIRTLGPARLILGEEKVPAVD